MSGSDSDDTDLRRAVVLDYLPHGPEGGRRRFESAPAGYALGVDDFQLYEVAFDADERVTIGRRVVVEPASDRSELIEAFDAEYEALSSGAQSELEYVVADLVAENETRFVEFFNEAGPITLRLHQLNLLPGIGEKLRNNVIDERKRGPFEDFEDLEERVSGLHDPQDILVERILEELRDEDVKYRLFVGRRPDEEA